MKTIITLLALTLGLGAMAQEESQIREISDIVTELGCVFSPKTIEPVVYVWDANAYYSAQIKQPTLSNEESYGTMLLSEDLPYVHTLRGSVYTFDFLQYTVRN